MGSTYKLSGWPEEAVSGIPPLTDATMAAAAGAALRRIRLERVVQDLEQLGMPDLAWAVVRRAESNSAGFRSNSADIPCGIRAER